ncbi:MAG: hypothetical protein DSO02_04795 [Hadesarchaea archaeon]|nr:MAG: hypothetical protein DSO02_04795 [Hadesarchaea archaeon]
MDQPGGMESKNLPGFKELMGRELERSIMDPTHVMALVRVEEHVREKLEGLEKMEIDLSTKSRTITGLTELATLLKVKYGYTLDVELVSSSLYHLSRGLNLYPCGAVAHYWPDASPVVFLLDSEIALVVAPRVE